MRTLPIVLASVFVLCILTLPLASAGSNDCKTLWHTSFCKPQCPCSAGQGDCDSDAECKSGLYCNFHPDPSKYGVPTDKDPDICEPLVNGCHKDALGGEDYCSETCKCGLGEGDCDNNKQCKSGLVCWDNVGPDFGFPKGKDVCLKPTSGCHEGYNGDHGFCSSTCKCGNGEGPCAFYDQCKEGHECIPGRGAEFGLPADTYVCIKGSPKCVPRWVCSEDGAHRQWKNGDCSMGKEEYCPGCYRGACSVKKCDPQTRCKNGNIVQTKSDCQEIVTTCQFGCNNGEMTCKKSLCEPERYCTGKKSLHTKDENCTTRDYSCFEACENGACVCSERTVCIFNISVTTRTDCTVKSQTICDFGCENGACKPPPCTAGWVCKDSMTKQYRNADCSYTSATACDNGCENGQCKQNACTTGWKCKDFAHRGYQYTTCEWTSVTQCPYGCQNGVCIQNACTEGWFCESGKRGYRHANCTEAIHNNCLYGCTASGGRCRTEEECIKDGACKPKCQPASYCNGINSVIVNEDCTKKETPCLYGCDAGQCKPEQTNIWGWRCKDTKTKGYWLVTGEWINTETCKYGCYGGRCALSSNANCGMYKQGEDGFCSKNCKCSYGQWPCKSNTDCSSGLLCLKDEEIVRDYKLKDGQGICGGFVNSQKLTYTKLLSYFNKDGFDFRMLIATDSQVGAGLFDKMYKNFRIGADSYTVRFKLHPGADFKDAPLTCKAKWEPHGFDANTPILHLNMVLEKENVGASNTNLYNGHFTMLVKKRTEKSRYCLVWYITKVKGISDNDMCGIKCLSKPSFDGLKRPPALPVDVPQYVFDQLLLRIGSLDGYSWPQVVPALTAGAATAAAGTTLVYIIDATYALFVTVQTQGATLGILPFNIIDIPGYEMISATGQSF